MKTMLEEAFGKNFKFTAKLTDDSKLDGSSEHKTPQEVADYLDQDPRHAIVLIGSNDTIFGDVTYEPALYVLRGAGEGLSHFFWGQMPAEDPNDAEGGDLTSAEALIDATIEYYT